MRRSCIGIDIGNLAEHKERGKDLEVVGPGEDVAPRAEQEAGSIHLFPS